MRIVRNSAVCKLCDTQIISKHVHDFVTCPCGNVSVDGGNAYIKRSADNFDMYEDTSLFAPEHGDTNKDGEEYDPVLGMYRPVNDEEEN